MNQSLDGYVDYQGLGAPSPELFRHYIKQVGGLAGSTYGRRLYEVMRYWTRTVRRAISRPTRAMTQQMPEGVPSGLDVGAATQVRTVFAGSRSR